MDRETDGRTDTVVSCRRDSDGVDEVSAADGWIYCLVYAVRSV